MTILTNRSGAIGRIIQWIGFITGVVCASSSSVYGLFLAIELKAIWIYFALTIGGSIAGFVTYIFIAGFGVLIETNCEIQKNTALLVVAQRSVKTKSSKQLDAEVQVMVEAKEMSAKEKAAENVVVSPVFQDFVTKPTAEKRIIDFSTKPVEKQPKTLKEELLYALKYETDEGLISHLGKIDDDLVKNILANPKHMVRDLVRKALETM